MIKPNIAMIPGERGAEYLGADGKVRRGTISADVPLRDLVAQAERSELSLTAAAEVRVWQMTGEGPELVYQRRADLLDVDYNEVEHRLAAHLAAHGDDTTEVMPAEG